MMEAAFAGPVPMTTSKLPVVLSPRLRVAVFSRNFDPAGGGAERYAIALVECLAAHHEIHVFSQHIRHQWPGVTYHAIGLPLRRPRWINQLWFAWATARATRAGFDLVHSHENTWHGQIQTLHVLPIRHNLFQGLTGVKRGLQWLRVMTSPRLMAYLWIEAARYRAKPGRTLVVTSQTLLDTLVVTHPHTRAMVHLVAPGVQAVPGRPNEADKSAARDRFGLPRHAQVLLLVANDFRKKGLTTLLEALKSLPDGVHLAIVGQSDQKAGYLADVNASGLQGRVHFLGALPDVTPAYVAADILVHPTLEDTFAMVVLEAMAHGLPVVVSAKRYCGISALLQHRKQAWLLDEPGDAVSLKSAVQTILGDPELAAGLSEAAFAFAKDHDWEHAAQAQDALYGRTYRLLGDVD